MKKSNINTPKSSVKEIIKANNHNFLEKDSKSLEKISSDILFTGRLFGTTFKVPTVVTVKERDEFPEELRYIGFLLHVEDVEETYQLKGGISNLSWCPILSSKSSWGNIKGSLEDQKDLMLYLSDLAKTDHTHSVDSIIDLKSLLDSKASTEHIHDVSSIKNLDNVLRLKAEHEHTHELKSIEGLTEALEGKSAFQHKHVVAEIANLKVFNNYSDGLVPKSDGSKDKFLRSDGVWAVP